MVTVMTRFIQFVMLAALVVNVDPRLSCNNINLPSQGNCSCRETEALVTECDGLKLTYRTSRVNENVRIVCTNPLLSTSTLPAIYIEYVVNLTLVNCLTSGLPVSDIIDQLIVERVMWLNVKGRMDTLHKGQLANLTKAPRVVLDGLGLSQIDTSVFVDGNCSHSSLTWLSLINNSITHLDVGVFSKLTELIRLDLSNNHLTTLPGDIFSHNSNLKTVILNDNQLENIDSLFGGKSNASESSIDLLEINGNNIRELDERVFSKLRNLKYLFLSHNQLTNLPPELFINNKDLIELDLSHNKLENIDRYLLKRLYKLEELDLSNNRLKHIEADLWFPIEKRKVNISYNQLTTFNEKFDYLQIYTIEVLDLSNNKLNNLTPITAALESINKLYLSNNNIQFLQLKDLAHIKTALFLHLDDNNITFVNLNPYQTESLNGNSPLVTVKLDNNPLNCDCHLHPFVRTTNNHEPIAFTNNRIQFETNMNLKCGSPPILNHRSIMDLGLEDLSCPTVDGCPHPCTCYYRPDDSYIIVNCSGVRVPTSLGVRQDNNKTQLILSNNQLSQFTYTTDTWPDVTQLDLSRNRLTTFNIRNNTRSLKVLNLSYNLLTSLTDDTVRNLQSLDSLSLHHNPWRCSCEDLELVNLVFNRKTIDKVDITKCEDGRLMMNLTESVICPEHFLIISAVIIVLLVVVVVGQRFWSEILIYLYNSNNRCLKMLVSHPDDINQHLPYDAFISFSHEDGDFISNHLLPQLEGRYKLCLHFRDWKAGEMIGQNVIRSILSSRRTIIVMSPNYLRSTWGSYEFEIAHMEGFRHLVNRMIVIMYEDIDNIEVRESVRLYMRTVTYLKWDNSPHFWKRLHYVMPHPPEDGGRITCFMGWCCKRRKEHDMDQEELIKHMLSLRPLAIVNEDNAHEEGGVDPQELLSSLKRLRDVMYTLRGTSDPRAEGDIDLRDLLEQVLSLTSQPLTSQDSYSSTSEDENIMASNGF